MRECLSKSVVTLAVLGMLSACGHSAAEPQGVTNVDPQVLQDVIDATFMVPGSDMRRAMRVQEFGRQKAIAECGGKAGPIDGTSNRFDQSHFPDLELIRKRGFFEQEETDQEDKQLEGLDPRCDLTPDLPRYTAWFVLQTPWGDVVASTEQDSGLTALKGPMADCLVRKTGLAVERSDPTTFLRAVNTANATGASQGELKNMAAAYADCGAPYFGKFRELLLRKRPAMVERNRELIERYASQIVGAGYVP